VMPTYHISASDHKVILRNFEGFITSYEEPLDYKTHDRAACPYCRDQRPEPGQRGVSGLLDGEAMTIAPEGFDRTHIREGSQHRLRENTEKWKPLGIGSGEGKEELE
jgi:lysine 2,3-aminomutase